MSNSRKEITVGFLWHSLGSGNLGVGALTESNIAIVRSAAEEMNLRVNFLILGTSDKSIPDLAKELNQAGHTLECHRVRIFRKSYRDLVKRCDFVLDIGEGDSFADIYGFERFFYHWIGKNIVCSLNRPLILSPQTIGPFDGAITRMMAKQIMWRCKKIFSRDSLSSDYLKSLGIISNTEEAIDVAFCLPYFQPDKKEEITKVGINVSGLLFNGGYTGNNQFGLTVDYAATVRQMIEYFLNNCSAEVHLISHVLEPNMQTEDDHAACEQLLNEYPQIILAPRFSRPSMAKSYIAQMDFFVGARMHACIGAYSACVPVIPMAYSRKFNGLFGTLGYTAIADCKKDDANSVLEKIKHGFAHRLELKNVVVESKKIIDQRISLYQSALKEMMLQVIQGR